MRKLKLSKQRQNDEDEAEQDGQDQERYEFWEWFINITHVAKIEAPYLRDAEYDGHNKLNDDVLVFFADEQL